MRRTALACAVLAAVLGVGLAAGAELHGSSPAKISVSGAYIPLPATPGMAAAYFDISNSGGSADRLLSASSPQVQSSELDQSTATSMVALTGGVAVPAHGSVAFARDGRHVMLMGLSPALRVGQHVELQLTFQHSGTITVQATVEPLTYEPAS
jgi:copper(I)-binding protein